MSQPRITYDGDPFIITEKHMTNMIVMLKDMLIHEATDASFLWSLLALKRKSI